MTSTSVLVIGVFDLFHRGHLELLRAAKSLGGRLVVVVNGDEFSTRYKRPPIYSEVDRLAIVSSIREVDVAFVSNSPDARPFLEEYGINVIVHGDDWDHESYLRQICVEPDYLLAQSIQLKYVPYYTGVSTSLIIKKIRESDS